MNANSSAIGRWLRRTADAIELTFCKLSRIQFDAPWAPRGRTRC